LPEVVHFADREQESRDEPLTVKATPVKSEAEAIVTLSGVVTSAHERDRALDLARETAGVTRVVDKLRIRKKAVD